MKKLPAKALKRIVLPDLDREYTLSEIAIITSAGPARALGLSQKGHLGVGADADVAIYNDEHGRRGACSPTRATSSRAARSWSRKARSATIVEGREFLVKPAYDRADRGLPAAAVPAALHDVVRELPGGDGARARAAARRVPARVELISRTTHVITPDTSRNSRPSRWRRRVLSPDVIAALGHDAIRALPVFLGKRQRRLDDFFDVEGAASDELEIRGDVGQVKWIGRGMTPRPHRHRRQRRHAPRRLHEGRHDRGDRQRLRLGRRRDARRADPHSAATPAGQTLKLKEQRDNKRHDPRPRQWAGRSGRRTAAASGG